MLTLLLVLLVVSGSLGVENPILSALTVTWSNIDGNNDNRLDFAEFTKEIFQSYDSNNDGKVTEGEFLTGWDRSYSHQHDAGISLFKQVDFDRDKFWTRKDLTVVYSQMDDNDDGKVLKHEFITYAAAVLTTANFIPVGSAVG
ncbi:uncharacterized protein LOC135475937 isoform X2 [Liolophura sinensis]|uniref:uncharacterized protein LOC135475937 isoform X2 n=1 Tax=Liolophura sinensis TaxID=3198878 RepID=UPI003158EAE4